MAEKTYKLKHPGGTTVEVSDSVRADLLKSRGYTEVGKQQEK